MCEFFKTNPEVRRSINIPSCMISTHSVAFCVCVFVTLLSGENCVFARDPPVAVASHLFHNLAVDLVLQGVVLGGRAKDLVD